MPQEQTLFKSSSPRIARSACTHTALQYQHHASHWYHNYRSWILEIARRVGMVDCLVRCQPGFVPCRQGIGSERWLHLRLSRHGNAVGAHHATALGLMWHGSAHAVVERVGVGAGTTHSRAACEHLASTPPHPWWKGP